jgi:hypothetical protein
MPAAVERRGARGRSALIAAYCEGLALAAVVVTCGPAGIRVSAVRQGTGGMPDEPAAEARWWCRRAADAERVAVAAMRRCGAANHATEVCRPRRSGFHRPHQAMALMRSPSLPKPSPER